MNSFLEMPFGSCSVSDKLVNWLRQPRKIFQTIVSRGVRKVRMRYFPASLILYCLALFAFSRVAAGQDRMPSGKQKSHAQVKVLTVCEVLADVSRYANSAVIVVGRMERSVSLIDQYQFLSEDQCEHPVITHGHVWLNKIQVWARSEKRMPQPPRAKLQLEQSTLAAKLLAVRQTTKLGTHEEPYFKTVGNSIVYAGQMVRPNEWGVVYGRIVRMPNLNEDCGVGGCGGDNVPLILIAEPTTFTKSQRMDGCWPSISEPR